MAKKTIGLVIVGAGKIAADQHAPALARNRRFSLLATVGPHGGLAGAPNYPSLEALAAAGVKPQAVSICTPPQVRGEIARAAIAAGYDVLLEKPPAATMAEFEDLKRRAAQAATVLFTAWHSRWAPMVAPARDWLAGRQVVSGRVVWREDVGRWHPGQAWLWAPGGLGVFDPGINALSILTAILPEAPMVRAAQFEVLDGAHTPIAARLSLATGAALIEADLDFRELGTQVWEIRLETACGHSLRLIDGGARLIIDDAAPVSAPEAEYDGLYSRFAELIDARHSEADAAPLQLVADAFLLAQTHVVEGRGE